MTYIDWSLFTITNKCLPLLVPLSNVTVQMVGQAQSVILPIALCGMIVTAMDFVQFQMCVHVTLATTDKIAANALLITET